MLVAALAALPARGFAADVVAIGVLNSIGDIQTYIAQSRGYFQQEGIDPQISKFDASSKMIAPLGQGELDVGGGATAVSLFNAIDRGIGVRIIADKGRTAPGYVYQSLMIRKALVESGEYKTYADLKGRKITVGAPGVGPLSVLNEFGKAGGVPFAEIEKVFLPFPQQVIAMGNGAIDGGIVNEPFKTLMEQKGIAVDMGATQSVFPNNEVSLVLFGEKFRVGRKEVALRYMRAFLRAARDYNDALSGGRWRTDGSADAVIGIFAKATGSPFELIKAITPPASDPDGKVVVESVQKDLTFFQDQGDVPNKKLTAADCMDPTLAAEAAKALGPYKPKS